MPIYDFQCRDCGHTSELIRKISESSLTTCPACGKESFEKMLSAPNFQLSGTGWYATDFKGEKSSKKSTDNSAENKSESASQADAPACAANCACH